MNSTTHVLNQVSLYLLGKTNRIPIIPDNYSQESKNMLIELINNKDTILNGTYTGKYNYDDFISFIKEKIDIFEVRENERIENPINPNQTIPNQDKINQAILDLEESPINIKQISGDENTKKFHCKLETNHKIRNAVRTLLITGFYTTTTVLSMGGLGVVSSIAGILGFAPIGPSSAVPFGPKNTYYLGYMHSRSNCIAAPAPEENKKFNNNRDQDLHGKFINFEKYPIMRYLGAENFSIGYVERGQASLDGQYGCFVWNLLTYRDTQGVRIIVFGGKDNQIRNYKYPSNNYAAFDANGFISCSLAVEDGQLYLVIIGQKELSEFIKENQESKLFDNIHNATSRENTIKIPIHWMDQIQFTSCGIRPIKTKWHITVQNGKVIAATQKGDPSKNEDTITSPEKTVIMEKAFKCNVWPDGTFGNGRQELSRFNKLKNLYKFNYEKIWNPRVWASKYRIEQDQEGQNYPQYYGTQEPAPTILEQKPETAFEPAPEPESAPAPTILEQEPETAFEPKPAFEPEPAPEQALTSREIQYNPRLLGKELKTMTREEFNNQPQKKKTLQRVSEGLGNLFGKIPFNKRPLATGIRSTEKQKEDEDLFQDAETNPFELQEEEKRQQERQDAAAALEANKEARQFDGGKKHKIINYDDQPQIYNDINKLQMYNEYKNESYGGSKNYDPIIGGYLAVTNF